MFEISVSPFAHHFDCENVLIIVLASFFPQKPANILVMGEGPERGRVKIGMKSILSSFTVYISCYITISNLVIPPSCS